MEANLHANLLLKNQITKKLTIENEILASKAVDNERHPGLKPLPTDTAWLVVSCPRADYSASAIARAVEDADAHLLSLNVESELDDEGMLRVSLRISHIHSRAVARSLERYGYSVVETSDGDDGDNAVLRRRAAELLHILEI